MDTQLKRGLGARTIVLLVLGSPVWLSLLIVAFAVAVSLFTALWVIIASFWACFVALVAGSLVGVYVSAVTLFGASTAAAGASFAASLACAGLAIFAFYGCLLATKGAVRLTVLGARGIKKCLTPEERE